MKKIILSLTFLLAATLSNAQNYIYLSYDDISKYMRFNMGVTHFSIRPSNDELKTAVGVQLTNEAKIISAFFNKSSKKRGITVHDAFYLDLNLGGMNSKQQEKGKGEKERKFAFACDFGYLGMAGYRNNKWGALAGVDFRFRAMAIGGVSLPNLDGNLLYFSRPLILRGEYNFSKEKQRRLITTICYGAGKKSRTPYQSARVEFQIGNEERWWVFGQYTQQKALGENHFSLQEPTQSTFKQFTIGLRLGYLP